MSLSVESSGSQALGCIRICWLAVSMHRPPGLAPQSFRFRMPETGVREPALLTSYQVMLMLPGQEPHFENQRRKGIPSIVPPGADLRWAPLRGRGGGGGGHKCSSFVSSSWHLAGCGHAVEPPEKQTGAYFYK